MTLVSRRLANIFSQSVINQEAGQSTDNEVPVEKTPDRTDALNFSLNDIWYLGLTQEPIGTDVNGLDDLAAALTAYTEPITVNHLSSIYWTKEGKREKSYHWFHVFPGISKEQLREMKTVYLEGIPNVAVDDLLEVPAFYMHPFRGERTKRWEVLADMPSLLTWNLIRAEEEMIKELQRWNGRWVAHVRYEHLTIPRTALLEYDQLEDALPVFDVANPEDVWQDIYFASELNTPIVSQADVTNFIQNALPNERLRLQIPSNLNPYEVVASGKLIHFFIREENRGFVYYFLFPIHIKKSESESYDIWSPPEASLEVPSLSASDVTINGVEFAAPSMSVFYNTALYQLLVINSELDLPKASYQDIKLLKEVVEGRLPLLTFYTQVGEYLLGLLSGPRTLLQLFDLIWARGAIMRAYSIGMPLVNQLASMDLEASNLTKISRLTELSEVAAS